MCNDGVASRAREAADVCWRESIGVLREATRDLTSTGVARGDVFALVAIFGRYHVDIDLALLHELAELREPLGGVDLRHVDGT